jgi:hypothetical protein
MEAAPFNQRIQSARKPLVKARNLMERANGKPNHMYQQTRPL